MSRPRIGCQPSRASSTGAYGQQGVQGVASKAGRALGVYRSPFLHRQSLQNKQCFHSQYMPYLSAARNTDLSSITFVPNTFTKAVKHKEQENPQVEMRLTLKGHHKCVATIPLARNPSYVLLAGPFGLQSVFFTSRKTAFLTTPNGLLPHHA